MSLYRDLKDLLTGWKESFILAGGRWGVHVMLATLEAMLSKLLPSGSVSTLTSLWNHSFLSLGGRSRSLAFNRKLWCTGSVRWRSCHLPTKGHAPRLQVRRQHHCRQCLSVWCHLRQGLLLWASCRALLCQELWCHCSFWGKSHCWVVCTF